MLVCVSPFRGLSFYFSRYEVSPKRMGDMIMFSTLVLLVYNLPAKLLFVHFLVSNTAIIEEEDKNCSEYHARHALPASLDLTLTPHPLKYP